MVNGNDDRADLPVRSPVTPLGGFVRRDNDAKNEENYDTLRIVEKILGDSLEALYKDFNAFNILKDQSKKGAAESLLRQIEGKQAAYDILRPTYDAVTEAIRRVNNKHKQ